MTALGIARLLPFHGQFVVMVSRSLENNATMETLTELLVTVAHQIVLGPLLAIAAMA
jgi:hypothetical protein